MREKRIDGALVETYHDHPASGRLVSITDALNQVKRFGYSPAGELTAIDYLHALHPTYGVSFAYDDPLGRMTRMTDGTGPAVYAYWPIAGAGQTVAGGGQLQEITRPSAPQPASYAIHLDYDVLGRVYRRTIGGAANVETLAFDKGRLAGVTNNLGMFTYRYEERPTGLQGWTTQMARGRPTSTGGGNR